MPSRISPPEPHYSLGALSALWLLGAFGLDLMMSQGLASGVAYAAPVLFALWSPNKRHTIFAAIVGTVLTVAGHFLSPLDEQAHDLINRFFVLCGIWGTTWAVVLQQDTKAALVEAEAGRARLLQLTEALFVAIRPDGLIVMANDKVSRILGKPVADLIGANWFNVGVIAADQDHVRAALARHADRDLSCESRLLDAHGVEHVIGWECITFNNMDGTNILLSGIDITQRLQAEATLREQAAQLRLSELAAAVAHQVKNPLAAVTGVLQVLEGEARPDRRRVVSAARERIAVLVDAIDHLLRYARPRPPTMNTVDLHALLTQLETGANGVRVRVEGGDDNLVQGDPELLLRAFLDLSHNAAQAMDGTGTIDITTSREGEYCVVEVRDDGPGIPLALRARVFEPFFSTHAEADGLGLAIVRRTVEAHGGTITVSCPAEGGTVFRVQLPAA